MVFSNVDCIHGSASPSPSNHPHSALAHNTTIALCIKDTDNLWLCCYRVKSLSKGNNPKRDVLSSNFNLKESTTIPLSSVTASTFEDQAADTWPEENDEDEFSPSEEYYDQGNPSWKKNGKIETYGTNEEKLKKPNGQIKWKELRKVESTVAHSDDDLNALLQVRQLRE